MTRPLLISIMLCTACCAGPPGYTQQGIFTPGPDGSVRAINLVFGITECQKQKDGVLKIAAISGIEGQSVSLAILLPTVWKEINRPEYQSEHAEFDLTFVPMNDSRLILDKLVSRCFGEHWSLFEKGGFSMAARANHGNVEYQMVEFGGFANMEDRDRGFLQCLCVLDVPKRTIRLAILVEGYGGSPPSVVDEWLRKKG